MAPGAVILRLTTLVLLLCAGCAQLQDPKQFKKEAQAHWSDMRGKLKYQLASDMFGRGQLDEAARQLDETISLSPEMGDAYVLRSRILLERGETASAAEALDQALAKGTDDAETDYLSGVIAQRYGKFADALAWYQRACEREPMNAPYVVAVAETLVALDRAAEALALVRSRWTDFEQNATLRALAGDIYMMLDRYEEAADGYREASRIAPQDRRLQSQLGIALSLAGSYEEGRAVLIAAVSSTEDQTPPEAGTLAALARCQLATDQADAAKASLRQAVDADPRNDRCWALLAEASIATGDLLSARRAAAEAVRLQPAQSGYQLLLALVCLRQRDLPGAAAAARAVLEQSPRDPLALQLLARAEQPERPPRQGSRPQPTSEGRP